MNKTATLSALSVQFNTDGTVTIKEQKKQITCDLDVLMDLIEQAL